MALKKSYQVMLPEKETKELRAQFDKIGIPFSQFLSRQVVWANNQVKKNGIEKFIGKNFK